MILTDNLITYLLNYAFDHGIGYTWTNELRPDFPSCAVGTKSLSMVAGLIKMNCHLSLPLKLVTQWWNTLLPSATIHDKNEHNANQFAIKLLQRYAIENDIVCLSSVQFCEQFGIPEKLSYLLEG